MTIYFGKAGAAGRKLGVDKKGVVLYLYKINTIVLIILVKAGYAPPFVPCLAGRGSR